MDAAAAAAPGKSYYTLLGQVIMQKHLALQKHLYNLLHDGASSFPSCINAIVNKKSSVQFSEYAE